MADAPLITDDTQTVAPVDAPLQTSPRPRLSWRPRLRRSSTAPLEGLPRLRLRPPVTLTEEPMVVASEEQP